MRVNIPNENPRRPRSRDEFEIAILCALKEEFDAVDALFDEVWENNGSVPYGKAEGDLNAYTVGLMGTHPVVLTRIPGQGACTSGAVAAGLRSSFVGIKLALLVGTCAGVPQTPDEVDILLGDIVISTGLVRYGFAVGYPNQVIRTRALDETLRRPNYEVRSILQKTSCGRSGAALRRDTSLYLADLAASGALGPLNHPGPYGDKLFAPSYQHKHCDTTACSTCDSCQDGDGTFCENVTYSTCTQIGCDEENWLVSRERLDNIKFAVKVSGGSALNLNGTLGIASPHIHFGTVSSQDFMMESGEYRDKIAKQDEVIAFESEGAGVWIVFPTVIIKGVYNYADGHRGEDDRLWRKYAAATAASCTKAFLKNWASPGSAGLVPSLTQGGPPSVGGEQESLPKWWITCLVYQSWPKWITPVAWVRDSLGLQTRSTPARVRDKWIY
ncbi:hypothetical protein TWF481_002333 [Arthrobotrys musiformis]|uniref:Nucleoside phosphorylase domain-containing protein n=1 Tax=Arthrobotrys musiformis TaxID=47236 RepID=A0AAV9VSX4_9PEZI